MRFLLNIYMILDLSGMVIICKKANENKILINLFQFDNAKLIVYRIGDIMIGLNIEGKKIKAYIYFNDSEKLDFFIGTLNQITKFYYAIKNAFFDSDLSLITIIIDGHKIEVTENDERTFSEIGIRNNFICKLKCKIKVSN